MSTYIRKNNDAKFRRIFLDSNSLLADFEEFQFPGQELTVGRNCVCEIMHTDGTTEIISDVERSVREYSVSENNNTIRISKNTPVARLWIEDTNRPGIRYKTPLHWKEIEGNLICCQIPAGVSRIKLIGDRYFDAMYELVRHV